MTVCDRCASKNAAHYRITIYSGQVGKTVETVIQLDLCVKCRGMLCDPRQGEAPEGRARLRSMILQWLIYTPLKEIV